MNDTLKFILIALIIVCVYHNYGKEGFSYRKYNVLEGYNNMVLTTEKGDLGSIAFPRGMIVIWNGLATSVPSGWALCDGNNGTPNLKGRFVLGVDDNNDKYRTVGVSAGGTETNTLTVAQLPAHNHSFLLQKDSQNSHNWKGVTRGINTGNRESSEIDTNTDGQKIIKETGEGKPVNNMPPYLVLAYIMKL
jgi:microcystin-dependent protein